MEKTFHASIGKRYRKNTHPQGRFQYNLEGESNDGQPDSTYIKINTLPSTILPTPLMRISGQTKNCSEGFCLNFHKKGKVPTHPRGATIRLIFSIEKATRIRTIHLATQLIPISIPGQSTSRAIERPAGLQEVPLRAIRQKNKNQVAFQ